MAVAAFAATIGVLLDLVLHRPKTKAVSEGPREMAGALFRLPAGTPVLNRTTLRATTKLLKQISQNRQKQSQKATSQYGLYLYPVNATTAHLSPPLIEGSRHRALLWAGRPRPRGHLSAKPCDYDIFSAA